LVLALGVDRDGGVTVCEIREGDSALTAGLIPKFLVLAVDETRPIDALFAGAGRGAGELRAGCDRCGDGVGDAATGRIRLR
jgi:hypothetical protein